MPVVLSVNPAGVSSLYQRHGATIIPFWRCYGASSSLPPLLYNSILAVTALSCRHKYPVLASPQCLRCRRHYRKYLALQSPPIITFGNPLASHCVGDVASLFMWQNVP